MREQGEEDEPAKETETVQSVKQKEKFRRESVSKKRERSTELNTVQGQGR